MKRIAIQTIAAALFVAAAACAQDSGPLRNPGKLTEQAPATFTVALDPSKGRFVASVHRDYAPLGADRFYNLVTAGFFANVRFFRVIGVLLAQFNMPGELNEETT